MHQLGNRSSSLKSPTDTHHLAQIVHSIINVRFDIDLLEKPRGISNRSLLAARNMVSRGFYWRLKGDQKAGVVQDSSPINTLQFAATKNSPWSARIRHGVLGAPDPTRRFHF